MFKYYQTGEKSAWKPIADTSDVETKAVSLGAKKVTILSVSEVIDDEETDIDNLSHKGPWYVDIDNKNILEAIVSLLLLLDKLLELGVPPQAIQIFASGGKGFHVLIPASVFSSGRPLKNLPAIYREMALELHVLGMDFQVYSGRRGVCWRLPNIEREDGNYRVPITMEEARAMTPEKYAEITSRPRIIPIPSVSGLTSTGLAALMEQAKRRVKTKPKRGQAVPDGQLVQFQDTPPECIHHLAEGKFRKSANFNEAGMQLGVFLARAVVGDQLAASLMSRMAENCGSSKYSTPRQRLDHLQGLRDYLKYVPHKVFICSAMRSLVDSNVCQGCALASKSSQFDDGDLHAEVEVEERFDGYYSSERKISTFTMQATDVYLEASLDGSIIRRVAIKVEACRDSIPVDVVTLPEECWTSNHSFKQALRGLNGAVFWGSSDDVQKIKYLVCNETRDMNQIIQTYAAGVHKHKIGSKHINVYVEPGFSINEIRMKGTHELQGTLSNPPILQTAKVPEPGDHRLNTLMEQIFDINSPLTLGQMIGWLSACHLKTHFMTRYRQFPLLNVWGNAGSGKSMTSILLAGLGGCDYTEQGHAPKTMASITQWALIDLASRTTTVPRILEEYNKSKMDTRFYTFAGEILKAAFNGQAVARGRLSRSTANNSGTEVVEYPILAPLLVVSEQAIQMPALQQRCIQVCMSHADRKGKSTVFYQAERKQKRLLNLALAMMIRSLSMHHDWVEERMDYWEQRVNPKVIERPRYSYKVILAGLDFLRDVMEELQLSAAERIPELQEAICGHVTVRGKSMSADKHRTEVDAVMESLATMAAMTANGGSEWLLEGRHYLKKEDSLFLDVNMAHAMYVLYQKYRGERPVMETPRQLQELLNQEYYYVTDRAVCQELKLDRTVTQLDMPKMAEKGILIQMF